MPLYEYKCVECGETIERIFLSYKDAPESQVCEKCQGKAKRLVSTTCNFILGGPGWSADGYSKHL